MTQPSTDAEVADHLETWLSSAPRPMPFSWPCDGCTYTQVMRFIDYRNEHIEDDFFEITERYIKLLRSGG